MKKSTAIIFPNQLFEQSEMIDQCKDFVIVEEYLFFNQFKFHKQKIAFHRATMKSYSSYLTSLGFKVTYINAISEFSDIRKLISKLPFKIKKIVTFFIALIIYFPLAKISKLFNYFGFNVNNFPLSDYKNKTFYFMATDSLDRFGTKLEKRFTKIENELEEQRLITKNPDNVDNYEALQKAMDKMNVLESEYLELMEEHERLIT